MIIAGDIGGTKTVLALYERTTEGLHQSAERAFASADYGSLQAILDEFLRDHRGVRLDTACFGIPGALIEGRVHTTNLTWDVSEPALEAALLDEMRAIRDGGGFGSIIGRNTFQRKKVDALKMLDDIIKIYAGQMR